MASMCQVAAHTRRWFQFSLGTMFIAITSVAILLFWLERTWVFVHERKVALEQLHADNRATILPEALSQHKPGRVSRLRECLGDEAVAQIWLPETSTVDDLARTRRQFPEAEVVVLEIPKGPDVIIGYHH